MKVTSVYGVLAHAFHLCRLLLLQQPPVPPPTLRCLRPRVHGGGLPVTSTRSSNVSFLRHTHHLHTWTRRSGAINQLWACKKPGWHERSTAGRATVWSARCNHCTKRGRRMHHDTRPDFFHERRTGRGNVGVCSKMVAPSTRDGEQRRRRHTGKARNVRSPSAGP